MAKLNITRNRPIVNGALVDSIKQSTTGLIKYIIENKPNIINVIKKATGAPLRLATRGLNLEAAQWLLDYRADKNIINKNRPTPFNLVYRKK